MLRRIGLLIAIVLVASPMAFAETAKGILLNDEEPWIVFTAGDVKYKVEWYGGSMLFWEGDLVLLTTTDGFGYMIGLTGLSKGKKARVWVEELD